MTDLEIRSGPWTDEARERFVEAWKATADRVGVDGSVAAWQRFCDAAPWAGPMGMNIKPPIISLEPKVKKMLAAAGCEPWASKEEYR